MIYASKTLCWRCANAVPNLAGTRGCSWSRKFIPVEGWDAVQTCVYSQRWNSKKQESETIPSRSFTVRRCPEFVSDGREDEE